MKAVIKKALIFVAAIVIIAIIYSVFAKKPEIQGSLSATPAAGLDTSLSADTQVILSLLQSIGNINLDTRIFERQSYLGLEDQEKMIAPDLNPGRDNPFAPMGIDVISVINPIVSPEQNLLNNLSSPNSGPTTTPTPTPTIQSSSTIKTSLPTAVTRSSAILWGELLTANQGAERYFEYGLNASNLASSSNKVVQSTTGTFSYTANNLIANTTYYFQAVVKIGDAILRGEVQTFRTLP